MLKPSSQIQKMKCGEIGYNGRLFVEEVLEVEAGEEIGEADGVQVMIEHLNGPRRKAMLAAWAY